VCISIEEIKEGGEIAPSMGEIGRRKNQRNEKASENMP
jgi:hypothetical protein